MPLNALEWKEKKNSISWEFIVANSIVMPLMSMRRIDSDKSQGWSLSVCLELYVNHMDQMDEIVVGEMKQITMLYVGFSINITVEL